MPKWNRADTVAVASVTIVGLVLRAWYVGSMAGSPFDPWRHLVLLRNLREGLGFTVFVGEPYVWYQPPWHALCSLLPFIGPEWIASFFSLICVPATYLWLRRESPVESRYAAVAGGLLMAAYGPLIRFTCHAGPESLALALLLGGLLLALYRDDLATGFAAGLIVGLGLVCRLNYVFAAPLFLPTLRRPPRAVAIVIGTSIPLALAWLRNARLLAQRDWVFTWDGLATPTSGFNFVSTLVPQMHPDVAEGLRRLHVQMFQGGPEWFNVPTLGAFMAIAAVCLIASRRVWLAAAFFATLVYLAIDGTGTGSFFRALMGLFPVMFAGIAISTARLSTLGTRGRASSIALVLVVVGLGAPFLAPPQGASPMVRTLDSIKLETALPPAELLTEERYLVNSGFYHPESLVYAFPDKRFLGLPLDPAGFDEFQRDYPDYRHILWHGFGVQDDLLEFLVDSGYYTIVAESTNSGGLNYLVLESTDSSR